MSLRLLDMFRVTVQALSLAVYVLLAGALSACATPPARDNPSLTEGASNIPGNTSFNVPQQPLAAMLAANFERLAFDVERDPLRLGERQAAEDMHILRRWVAPILYEVVAVEEQGTAFALAVDAYLRRLAEISGHPISRATGGRSANLRVALASDEQLRGISQPDDVIKPGESEAARDFRRQFAERVSAWRATASPCAGWIWHVAPGSTAGVLGEISQATVIIRAELSELTRQTCIEEELAQVLGLMNDHPQAYPSIFNDDGQFNSLTDQDAALLRILYDPRLSPGMSPEIAMPIVRDIAAETTQGR